MVLEYHTAILVFVTAIYAYLTHKMAKAERGVGAGTARSIRGNVAALHEVTPYVRPHTTVLYLRIENTRRTGAENVQLSMDQDFYEFGEKTADHNLRKKAAFTQSIDSLGPEHKLNFPLAQCFVIFGDGAGADATPQQYNITAAYEFGARKVKEVHRIDLRPYIGTEGERDPVLEELEKIRQVLERRR